MTRKYVIMRWDDSINSILDNSTPAEPVDVVSTMTRADEICTEMEAENPEFIFFWREIISSED